ncbi:hypothetical protein MLD38_002467 [Melastoma candidum]|uniref:Uncharacterized protein n=1 Tax=Melastoma candidum TaxID=119954 RepID=A0ACB9S7Z7_9MYRT|nr:hypothetical protein MLD38_002467 [Melastoma candidum]
MEAKLEELANGCPKMARRIPWTRTMRRSAETFDSVGKTQLRRTSYRHFLPVSLAFAAAEDCLEAEKMNADRNEKKASGRMKGFHPGIAGFFVQLPQKLQNGIKFRLEAMERARDRGRFGGPSRKGGKFGSSARKEGKSLADFEAEMKEQMQAWKENPTWVEPTPEIKVTVPKGSFCNLSARVNVGLPPDAVYNIVIDPDNKRVFKNIKEVISREVLVDDGLRQVVDVEQAAIWKFLWWSGTISVHVLVEQNRTDHTMRFKQLKTGFMDKFEGLWRVEPLFIDEHLCTRFRPKSWEDYRLCSGGKGRVASSVSLEQVIQPTLIPPPPISWYLRGITTKTTEMLINDLVVEAARIRGRTSETETDSAYGMSETSPDVLDQQVPIANDIKARWSLRRRSARQRS